MVGWLDGSLFGWLVHCLVGWLVGRSVGRSVKVNQTKQDTRVGRRLYNVELQNLL